MPNDALATQKVGTLEISAIGAVRMSSGTWFAGGGLQIAVPTLRQPSQNAKTLWRNAIGDAERRQEPVFETLKNPGEPILARERIGMTVLTHAVYAAAYILTGVSVGTVVPYIWTETGPLTGGLVGAVIVLGGAIVHEVVTRMEMQSRHGRRLRRIEEALADLTVEITRGRSELERLTARFEEACPGGSFPHFDTVMDEVRILQSLVGRLQERRGPREAPRPAAARKVPESGTPLVAPSALAIAAPSNRAGGEPSVLETVRDALRADRIDIYLQPIVSLPQRKHRFYEVFSRVRSADGTQIKPDRYLDVAAREGLIPTIDNLLLVRCIQLIRETERRQHSIGFFSNISAATINDAEFMRQFLQFMAQNRPHIPKLVFELSQEDWTRGDPATLSLLGQLAKLGFHFSMDQVANLDIDIDMLVRAEIRYLKLDRALFQDAALRPRAMALRKALEGRPVDLVVEKIETENQLAEIADFGIDFGQGYLFGEPRLSRKPG